MMSTVTIEVDSRLLRFVRSQFFVLIPCVTGVCLTFTTLFAYWTGQGKYRFPEWFILLVCVGVNFGASLPYYRLAGAVIRKLNDREAA